MKRIKKSLSIIAACLATSALLIGCGAEIKQATPMDTEKNPRVEAATKAFGPGFEYMIITSKSELENVLFIAYYKAGGELDINRALFNRIAQAEAKGVPFMVTGESAEKTFEVVTKALQIAPDNSLTNLELLYLGEEQYVKGIEEAVKRVGGKMRFAPYPG